MQNGSMECKLVRHPKLISEQQNKKKLIHIQVLVLTSKQIWENYIHLKYSVTKTLLEDLGWQHQKIAIDLSTLIAP